MRISDWSSDVCSSDLLDIVLVADLPEAAGVGVVRYALEKNRRGAVGQRPVADVALSGDPADIGGAPVDLTGSVVEDVLMRHRHEHHVAAGRVPHSQLGSATCMERVCRNVYIMGGAGSYKKKKKK